MLTGYCTLFVFFSIKDQVLSPHEPSVMQVGLCRNFFVGSFLLKQLDPVV